MHKRRFFIDNMVRKTEREMNKKINFLKLTDRVTFGKHRNKNLETVILEDPEYIQWAFDNLPGFYLDEEATKVWRNRMLAKEGEE